MDLESIVSGMHDTFEERFVTREDRAHRLYDISGYLDDAMPEAPTTTQLAMLDDIWLRLQGDDHSHLYADALASIQRQRSPYRKNGPKVAYQLMNAKNTKYVDRFKEIKHYLSQDTYTYDDVALALDSLTRNRYVRKRAARDKVFDAEVTSMQQELSDAMMTRWQPQQSPSLGSRLGRMAQTALVGASALVMGLCMVPTSVYQTLMG